MTCEYLPTQKRILSNESATIGTKAEGFSVSPGEDTGNRLTHFILTRLDTLQAEAPRHPIIGGTNGRGSISSVGTRTLNGYGGGDRPAKRKRESSEAAYECSCRACPDRASSAQYLLSAPNMTIKQGYGNEHSIHDK